MQRVNDLIGQRKGDLGHEEALVDDMIRQLESTRELGQTIMVLDADAFYCSAQELEGVSSPNIHPKR